MAIRPRLHVFLIFMIQFVLIMALVGGVVPTLHQGGWSWAILVPAAIVSLVILHYLISVVGRVVPVKCPQCSGRSRYRGFGWWPFAYRYVCASCGTTAKYDVVA